MKNYKEIAESVFEKRDIYVARQKKNRKILKYTSFAVCTASVLLVFVNTLNKDNKEGNGSTFTNYSIEAISGTTQVNKSRSYDNNIGITEISNDSQFCSTSVAGVCTEKNICIPVKSVDPEQDPSVTTVTVPALSEHETENDAQKAPVCTLDSDSNNKTESVDIEAT